MTDGVMLDYYCFRGGSPLLAEARPRERQPQPTLAPWGQYEVLRVQCESAPSFYKGGRRYVWIMTPLRPIASSMWKPKTSRYRSRSHEYCPPCTIA